MWYHTRYVYNLLLTAFQIIGLALLGLGTATIALTAIGVMFCAIQRLLGYELLLTQDTVRWPIAFGITSCALGAALALLGLGATHPKYVQRQG